MEINAEDFRRLYQSLSDNALQALSREDLVDLARDCYDQELASRGLSRFPANQQIEPSEDEAQGFVEVSTFPSSQEANYARDLLDSAEIPVVVENEPLITGHVRLMVPPEYLEEAREVLEATPISDEELAAQAEAESPPEE